MTDIVEHDALYSAEYYTQAVEGPAAFSALPMASSIYRAFKPRSVVDLGCGTGALLAAFKKFGVSSLHLLGLDYATAALEWCDKRGITARQFDIEGGELPTKRVFDVACSFEVAEHVPESAADRLVQLLCTLSPVVVMTAAPPGQGGVGHINEQSQWYWIRKFDALDYELDDKLVAEWAEEWEATGHVAWWYSHNLMCFRKQAH